MGSRAALESSAANCSISPLLTSDEWDWAMLRQNKSLSRYRDESVASKWDQLKQYEEETSEAEQPSQSRELREYERSNGLFVARTFQQIRETSSKTYSNIKNTVTELYRKTRSKTPAATASPPPGSGFSQSPHGFQDTSSAGTLQSLGMIGAKIRNSKSLQNLEVATLDNFRQIVDSTASAAENLKHKYGSRVELQNRAKYDKFKDDGDSEDERDM